MTTDLLPCPFCGNHVVSTYFDHERGDKWGYASCDGCAARGPEVRTNYDRDDKAPWRAEAIAAWNRRADLSPSPEVVKELVDALRDIAGQKTFLEMTKDEHASADFEDGYDLCVRRARAALAKLEGGE